MPENFLRLDRDEQSRIYRALAPQLGRSPVVLEKDVWVCWVLQAVFTMPRRIPMAFKGGTSLSKVYGAIARFSEDVDITLDYRGLGSAFDPFAEGVSRSRLAKLSNELKTFVRGHIHDVVAPHLQRMLAAELDADAFKLHASEDGEHLRVRYPTVLDTPGTMWATASWSSSVAATSPSRTRRMRSGPTSRTMLLDSNSLALQSACSPRRARSGRRRH